MQESNTLRKRYIQFIVLPDDETVRSETYSRGWFLNIITTEIQLFAFMGFNYNNCIIMYGMENIKTSTGVLELVAWMLVFCS